MPFHSKVNIDCCCSPKFTEKPKYSDPFEGVWYASCIIYISCLFFKPAENKSKSKVESKGCSNHSKSKDNSFRVSASSICCIIPRKYTNGIELCFRDVIANGQSKNDKEGIDEDDSVNSKP